MYYYESSRELDHEGLVLHVSDDHMRGARSRWRVRRPGERIGQYMLRFEVDEQDPFLWARIDMAFEDFMVLKRADRMVCASVFEPMKQAEIERVERELRQNIGEPEHRTMCWARRFAQWLGGPHGDTRNKMLRHHVLWGGMWHLTRSPHYAHRLSTWRADYLEEYMACFRARSYHVNHMDLMFPWPVRVASREDASRVKYYRKLSRQGILPPVLCLWVYPFGAPIILDGHDRMLAAILERREPEILILEPFTTELVSEEQLQEQQEAIARQYEAIRPSLARISSGSLDHFNRQAVFAHMPRHHRSMLRVWPLRDGAASWRAEVSSQLALLPPEELAIGNAVLHGIS